MDTPSRPEIYSAEDAPEAFRDKKGIFASRAKRPAEWYCDDHHDRKQKKSYLDALHKSSKPRFRKYHAANETAKKETTGQNKDPTHPPVSPVKTMK